MDLTTLRQNPVYQTAMRTPSIMRRLGGYGRFGRFSRKTWNQDFDTEIQEAGLRLDHIMRNTIGPDYTFPPWDSLSVMKVFVDAISERMHTGRIVIRGETVVLPISQLTHNMINPRLDFCREILRQANEELVAAGKPVVSGEWFEHFYKRVIIVFL